MGVSENSPSQRSGSIGGGTSSGKTSLLASTLTLVDDAERIVVVEDTAELACDADHQVRLEARPANPDGPPPIEVGDLVRTALRLRPDRLVVGEVRGDEVLGLVQAMNTGHDGSFSTLHANGALDALLRIESLVLQAAPRWPLVAVRQQLARSIDVVVHVARTAAIRRVVDVSEVVESVGDSTLRAPAVRRLMSLDGAGRTIRHDELRRGRR
ncbi:ATPase, T2SS/T4P/T4SS family [Ilumatobacter sp.]|uniref:ATPase, T2SS/T4P/T4SS family n=1 Tax=Ilumatobacter sp. TaxID=1967498 RepID=UPI003B523472